MHSESKIEALKREIQHYTNACKSPWPQPSDYTRLIDAQYALRAEEEEEEEEEEEKKKSAYSPPPK